jgi:membrane protease YdiL (CAAX protease family)
LTNPQIRWSPLLGTLMLAGAFWFFAFYVTWGAFWLKISFFAAVLAGLALRLQPNILPQLRLDKNAILVGLGSAAALYLIFFGTRALITMTLPFAPDQIEEIYRKGQSTPLWAMAALSLLVMGPSEELFWRGYLQRQLMNRFGNWQGWLMGTILYAGVHSWAFNLTLVGAAMVAGAFWGALYWRFNNLVTVMVSHSIWSVLIFAILPMG